MIWCGSYCHGLNMKRPNRLCTDKYTSASIVYSPNKLKLDRFPFKFDTKRTGLANPDWVILIRPLMAMFTSIPTTCSRKCLFIKLKMTGFEHETISCWKQLLTAPQHLICCNKIKILYVPWKVSEHQNFIEICLNGLNSYF